MSKSWLAVPIVLSLLLSQPVAAQQPEATEESPSTSNELADQGLFRIDFRGGSVEEFIDLVKASAPDNEFGSANIVMPGPKPTFTFELPSIQVITDVEGALECLSACSTAEVDVDVSESDSGHITFVRLVDLRSSNPQEDTRTVQVFNLKRVLMETPKENVVAAIDLGLEISGSAGSTVIKLHDETGLLFAKGQYQELEIIAEIVAELSKTVTQMNTNQYSTQNGTYQPNQTFPSPNPYSNYNPGNNPYAPQPTMVPSIQVNPQPGPQPPPYYQDGSINHPPTPQTTPPPANVDAPADRNVNQPSQTAPPIIK